MGNPVWNPAGGQIDGALDFDGVDDYVPLSANAVTTTEFTITAWANHYGPGGGLVKTNSIFCQREDAMGPDHSAIHLITELKEGSPDAYAIIRSSDGPPQMLTYPKRDYNQWHHYAMTVSSSDFIFYVDGTEVNRTSNDQAGDYVTAIDYVDIGRDRYAGANHGFFNGAIDDVRIYGRASSADEIQELYEGSAETVILRCLPR